MGVPVQYEDLKDGMQAMGTLQAVKNLLAKKQYCDDELRCMLGVELEDE